MPPSRRQALQRAVGVACVLAGCATDDRPPTSTPTAGVSPIVDFEAAFVRSQTSEPFVALGDETSPSAADTSFTREPLLTAEDADQVSFSQAVDGIDEARAFLDDTDFDREAIYLAEQRISACRRLEVSHVTTDGDEFDIEFCSPLRPADVECRVDETDAILALVRFPFAADEISGYSVGGGTNCRRPHPPEGSS